MLKTLAKIILRRELSEIDYWKEYGQKRQKERDVAWDKWTEERSHREVAAKAAIFWKDIVMREREINERVYRETQEYMRNQFGYPNF